MKKAFTLIELLVAILISSILIGTTVSVYTLFQRSMGQDQFQADVIQNARVALDRLTRELRQTPDVVTVLPDDPNDNSVQQPGAIEFEDGHNYDLSYHRYYIVGGVLKMDEKEYYFSYQNSIRVHWNSVGNGGVAPISRVISTIDIADNVQSLTLYGSNLIQIIIETGDGSSRDYQLRTTVMARNL